MWLSSKSARCIVRLTSHGISLLVLSPFYFSVTHTRARSPMFYDRSAKSIGYNYGAHSPPPSDNIKKKGGGRELIAERAFRSSRVVMMTRYSSGDTWKEKNEIIKFKIKKGALVVREFFWSFDGRRPIRRNHKDLVDQRSGQNVTLHLPGAFFTPVTVQLKSFLSKKIKKKKNATKFQIIGSVSKCHLPSADFQFQIVRVSV